MSRVKTYLYTSAFVEFILSLRLKLFIVRVRRSSSDSEFQTAGPAYEKTRSTNLVRVHG